MSCSILNYWRSLSHIRPTKRILIISSDDKAISTDIMRPARSTGTNKNITVINPDTSYCKQMTDHLAWTDPLCVQASVLFHISHSTSSHVPLSWDQITLPMKEKVLMNIPRKLIPSSPESYQILKLTIKSHLLGSNFLLWEFPQLLGLTVLNITFYLLYSRMKKGCHFAFILFYA